jgi:hypothetical protein
MSVADATCILAQSASICRLGKPEMRRLGARDYSAISPRVESLVAETSSVRLKRGAGDEHGARHPRIESIAYAQTQEVVEQLEIRVCESCKVRVDKRKGKRSNGDEDEVEELIRSRLLWYNVQTQRRWIP